ncbi:hypothetical protein CPB86DRAFT_798610 [Serendipita vermifera]|nr:hypothetical protein CPB86DRAFT_798610 [Serendipita vermifera]
MATPEPNMDRISSLDESQLSELRWKLHDNIRGGSKGDDTNHMFVSLYNRVIDALHKLEINRRIDPMERLPDEIITEIIFRVSGYKYSWFLYLDIDRVLTLTMVSKKWQGFILSEPLFWNFLAIDNRQDLQVKLFLQLELSRDLPLTIEVTLPLEGWELIRPGLIRHRTRINTIVVHRKGGTDDMYDTQRQANDYRNFLDDMGHLPSLRRLGNKWYLDEELINLKDALHRFPSLTEMPKVAFTANDLQLAKDRLNIGALNTYGDMASILPIAQTVSNLKNVHFFGKSSTLLPDIIRRDGFQTDSPSTLANPLGWTTFAHHRYEDTISVSFLSRLSQVVSLEMTIRTNTIYDIASIIHQLYNLYEVQLVVQAHFNDRIPFPKRIIPNMNVRSLSVSAFFKSRHSAQWNKEDTNNGMSGNIDTISLTLLQAMPKLYNLRLGIENRMLDITSFPFFSIDRLFDGSFQGEKLHLNFNRFKVVSKEDFSVPSSVHDVAVVLDHYHSANYFSSQFIKQLYMSVQEPSTKIHTSEGTNMIDLKLWPSLESVRISRGNVQWDKSSLAFLRKVHIGYNLEPSIHNVCTSFLRDIACRPESYPSLEEIALDGHIEYDILMIMLERRNLLTGSSIKKITKLHLWKPYLPQFRPVLRALLQCKWVERSTNWELSLAGNAEAILDLSL